MKIKKPHYYLTEERARKLEVGTHIECGYDDFNKGKFGCAVDAMPRLKRKKNP